MSRRDGAERFDRRRVVEQHTSAAIDLDVDEARRQESLQTCRARWSGLQHGCHATALDGDGCARADCVAIEEPGGGQHRHVSGSP